jgi:hypothetical protein
MKSNGILSYGPGIRAAVAVDEEISKYYRRLIPKYYTVQPQLYSAHITVVRTGLETPTNMEFWDKYAGEVIEFDYSNVVCTDGRYYYLQAWSERIGDIREELGLRRFRFNDLEDSSYHITIGNCKT